MLVSLILANPKPESFGHALAQRANQTCMALGHAVRFHDLCAEGFDPLITAAEMTRDAVLDPLVARHCEEIREADALVIVHPNWWGQPPAILKGWVDRVLRPGVAYEFLEGDGGEGVPKGLLKAKVAVVLNTSDTPMAREREIFGDPLEALWGRCILPFCGVHHLVRHTYGVMVTSTQEQRQAWLDHAEDRVRKALSR